MAVDSVKAPYNWIPCQSSFSVSTTVHTLLCEMVDTFTKNGDSLTQLIRLERNAGFQVRDTPRCSSVGGTFVFCKGSICGQCPRSGVIFGRLPASFRPHEVLLFAATSREAYDVGGHVAYQTALVTLAVRPDGFMLLVGGKEPPREGTIDLSAVRFCSGKGISLVDEVSLHTLDIYGSRLVTLQGRLANRWWTRDHRHPLALLPESCRPPKEIPFIVTGTSSGGFHLVLVRPSFSFGCGGDLMWKDGVWNRDKVNFTGIMFEVASDAMKHPSFTAGREGASVLISDFQQFLLRRFGSIEEAWHQAFDLDGSGQINFTEFGLGCKAAGYVGNATRLWAALDEDASGSISLSELLADSQPAPVPDDEEGGSEIHHDAEDEEVDVADGQDPGGELQ